MLGFICFWPFSGLWLRPRKNFFCTKNCIYREENILLRKIYSNFAPSTTLFSNGISLWPLSGLYSRPRKNFFSQNTALIQGKTFCFAKSILTSLLQPLYLVTVSVFGLFLAFDQGHRKNYFAQKAAFLWRKTFCFAKCFLTWLFRPLYLVTGLVFGLYLAFGKGHIS